MKLNENKNSQSVDQEILLIPIIFSFGCIFYFCFNQKILDVINYFLILFISISTSVIIYRKGFLFKSLVAILIFILGIFYSIFYDKIFLKNNKIEKKIYVDVVGKVISKNNFYNPINNNNGSNIVVNNLEIYKAEFKEKSHPKKKKIKKHKTKKTSKNKKFTEKKIQNHKKENNKKTNSDKKIIRDFVNVKGYQELDREFLDFTNSYQKIDWIKHDDKEIFPKNLQKISINLNQENNISINDKIFFRALLYPPQNSDFKDGFDYVIESKIKKIGAYGFAFGDVIILEKSSISNINQWFLHLREIIRNKINQSLNCDEASIIVALLIGDQNQISSELMTKIRNSGLAHLLSISGFHLSLAGLIFFSTSRFLLSRSEYFTLRFDIKKISSFIAIFASYFYMQLASSPTPAKRSFIMIFLFFIALILNEKPNAKRILFSTFLLIILINPPIIFNISFQLSFIAILTLIVFYEEINLKNIAKPVKYPLEVILLSLSVQITTLPFLIHSFSNISLLGFISNVLAIPIASFVIMPAIFLSLFFMIIGLEFIPLYIAKYGVVALEKIINFVVSLNYSNITTPTLTNFGLIISSIGLLLFFIFKNKIRIFGIMLFCLSFLTLLIKKENGIFIEKNQKFVALYDQNKGLIFAKGDKKSKQKERWMKYFNEKNFNSINGCDKEKCYIEFANKKILLLFKRNKISDICKNDFDIIINLTKKYKLPPCIDNKKIKFDNIDFIDQKTKFIKL